MTTTVSVPPDSPSIVSTGGRCSTAFLFNVLVVVGDDGRFLLLNRQGGSLAR